MIGPILSKKQINKAGESLRVSLDQTELEEAERILSVFRARYVSPLDRFQKILRRRVSKVDSDAIVSQRLKRTPSIRSKLKRSEGRMKLARMQDIGGLRAVVKDILLVRQLEDSFVNNQANRFTHVLKNRKDYINEPKSSGYRGIHLVYECQGSSDDSSNGILLEIQIRTKIQHSWATAVETVGTFLNQSIKSSEGDAEWNEYFSLASCAFALLEDSPVVSEYNHLAKSEIFREFIKKSDFLQVKKTLLAYSTAVEVIGGKEKHKGNYHLLILNYDTRMIKIRSFGRRSLADANKEYFEWEQQAAKDKNLQVVLVSIESIDSLRLAYPSYFLDAREFISLIEKIESLI